MRAVIEDTCGCQSGLFLERVHSLSVHWSVKQVPSNSCIALLFKIKNLSVFICVFSVSQLLSCVRLCATIKVIMWFFTHAGKQRHKPLSWHTPKPWQLVQRETCMSKPGEIHCWCCDKKYSDVHLKSLKKLPDCIYGKLTWAPHSSSMTHISSNNVPLSPEIISSSTIQPSSVIRMII